MVDDARGVNGILFLIQSNVAASHYLVSRVYKFLEDHKPKIFGITDEDFDKYRKSLILKIMENDYTLKDEASRHWNEIIKHKYTFDRRNREKELLEQLKKEDFLTFVDNLLYSRQKILESHFVSSKTREENEKLRLERLSTDSSLKQALSVDWFKRRMPLYPDYYSQL